MKKIYLLLLCIWFSNVIIAQNAVEEKLTELLDINNAPGINFSIIYPDGVQKNYSAGYADIEKGKEMKPSHTMFSGSIGKTYAIAVIAQLADEGLIDLNRRFIEYFPDVDWLRELPNIDDFTVLQLMQHRSGLPRYAFKEGVWETAKSNPDKVWSYKDRLSYVFGDTAVHAAGNGFAYSDTGYLLLGMLLEKITGKYFYDAIRERVIEPLELKQTYAADKRSYPNAANTYSRDEVFRMPGASFVDGVCKFNPQMENAGGGFVSTASDLARWAKLYYEGAPFSEAMKETIQKISPDGRDVFDGWHCGAGIFILETKYGLAYGHTGLMVGTRSIMLYFPDYNISAALQMNTDKPEGELGLLGSLEMAVELSINSKNRAEYSHYEINLQIEPETKRIMVQGFFIPGTLDSDAGDVFYLDRGMEIEYFGQEGKNMLIKDSISSDIIFMPEASRMYPESPAEKIDKTKRVEFSYSGSLSKLPEYFANILKEEWVEIGLYYPWFPYNPDIKLFTYKVNVLIDKSYKVFGIGTAQNTTSGWLIVSDTPTNDIVICATKNIDIRQWYNNDNTISIYYENLSDSIVDKLQSDISSIMEGLNKRYGGKEQNTIFVKSKRTKGGAYIRIGGIFLGGLDQEAYYKDREAYCRYFAHELSHLWWFKANTNSWEDWLNEGFAEYSALLTMRDRYGVDKFENRILIKKQAILGTPPVWGFDRGNLRSESELRTLELVLYSKAPVLLYELEKKIGKQSFKEFSKTLLDNDMRTTQFLLETLGEKYGKETEEWFIDLLQNY